MIPFIAKNTEKAMITASKIVIASLLWYTKAPIIIPKNAMVKLRARVIK